MKLSKCHVYTKEIQYYGHILSATGIKPLPSKMEAIKIMQPPKDNKQVQAFLRLVGYYWKFIKNFAQIAKPLTALTHHDAKFSWIPNHQTAFISLIGAPIQAPILHYQDTLKWYIVYTDTSDDACGAQLLQEHNGCELPVTFLSHTFTDTKWKWSIPKQEAYGVYFIITKWNYYLQGSDILMHNDHTPLQKLFMARTQTTKWINGH